MLCYFILLVYHVISYYNVYYHYYYYYYCCCYCYFHDKLNIYIYIISTQNRPVCAETLGNIYSIVGRVSCAFC